MSLLCVLFSGPSHIKTKFLKKSEGSQDIFALHPSIFKCWWIDKSIRSWGQQLQQESPGFSAVTSFCCPCCSPNHPRVVIYARSLGSAQRPPSDGTYSKHHLSHPTDQIHPDPKHLNWLLSMIECSLTVSNNWAYHINISSANQQRQLILTTDHYINILVTTYNPWPKVRFGMWIDG